MKKASDELFLLIKSLTTQEKVYFKVFSVNKRERSQSSGYLQLFNVLDKMKVYDKKMVRSNLKNAGYSHKVKGSKRRLNEAIFKSLMDYHSDLNNVVELQQLIHRIYILIEKNLLNTAIKLLIKAKEIANADENYEHLLTLSALEKQILRLKSDAGLIENYLITEIDKSREYIKCLNNINEYENLSFQIEPLEHMHSGKKFKNASQKLRQILRHPLMQNSNSAITYASLKYFYSIKFRCAMLLGEIDEDIYNGQKAWIEYLEKDRSKLIKRKINYLGGLNDIIISLSTLGNYGKADFYFTKSRRFIQSLPFVEKTGKPLLMIPIIYCNYIAAQLKVPDPRKALEAWEELRSSFDHKKSEHIIVIILFGNVTIAYFLLKQYREASVFANKIIDYKGDNRIDIQRDARLLLLLAIYELKKSEQLPYIAKSIQRYLINSNGYISEFDKCILNYFERKLPEITGKQKEYAVFCKWKIELLQLPRKSVFYHEAADSRFDFISWIESKIQNKPLIEIMRKKTKLVVG